MEERTLERWMALEIGRLHAPVVRAPRPLPDLLLEDEPKAATREGDHVFDKDALRRLADALGVLTRARLRLPVICYAAADVPGDVYVADGAAQRALRELRAAVAEPRDGKLWLAEPLARDLARRYPTCFQFVVL